MESRLYNNLNLDTKKNKKQKTNKNCLVCYVLVTVTGKNLGEVGQSCTFRQHFEIDEKGQKNFFVCHKYSECCYKI